MTRLSADWRSAPGLVKAFVIAPVVGIATGWAFGAHVRAHPTAGVLAAVLVLLLTGAVIGRNVWAWLIFVALYLLDFTRLIHLRHPVERPPGVVIVVDVLYVVLLFSPPMLEWVGVSQRILRRTGSGD